MIRSICVVLALVAATWNGAEAQAPWPRLVALPEGDITLYEPQIESLNSLNMSARMAISVTPIDSDQSVFGTLWLLAKIKTDRAAGIVTCQKMFVKQVRFPGATEEQIQKFTAILKSNLPQSELEFPIDWLNSLKDQEKKEEVTESEVGFAAPLIIPASRPTVLVTLQGEPVLGKSEFKGLMKVVNTPFEMYFEPGRSTYYLRARARIGDVIWRTKDLLGSWELADDLSEAGSALVEKAADFSSLPKDVTLPEIIVSTEPAELILIDGKPLLKAIPGTSLHLVGNTRSDVLVNLNEARIYVLLSGRWFTSLSKYGPWDYVPWDQLPPDFKKIPADFDRPNVLASIPDTELSRIARLDTFVPQTATIHRAGPAPTVVYNEAPKFEPIKGAAISYAVNTESAVVKVGDVFLCCQDGVWFESAKAEGPWAVATKIPKEIEAIPPTCPIYSAKFVGVYETDDSTVTVGYTPGYLGCYRQSYAVVYGAGLPYERAKGDGFHPTPFTYGFNMIYDLWDRTWKSQSGLGSFVSPSVHWWGPNGFQAAQEMGTEPPTDQLTTDGAPNVYLRNPEWLTDDAGQRRLAEGAEIEEARVAKAEPTPVPEQAVTPPDGVSTSDARWEALRNLSEAEKAQADQEAAEAEQRRAEAAVYSDEEGNVYKKNNDRWESVQGGNAPDSSVTDDFDRHYSSRSSSSRRRSRDLLHTTGYMSRTIGYGGSYGDTASLDRRTIMNELGFVEIPGFGW